jgi:hypothetical protein
VKHPLLSLALVAAASAHAGYACLDPADPEQRRWFQTEPCAPPLVHRPLPDAPLIIEAPRLPDGWGADSGSQWQVLGYDERGSVVGYWVRSGTAVPFVSTEAVRVTGPRGTRGRVGGRR